MIQDGTNRKTSNPSEVLGLEFSNFQINIPKIYDGLEILSFSQCECTYIGT
jgi:hypothetical protein